MGDTGGKLRLALGLALGLALCACGDDDGNAVFDAAPSIDAPPVVFDAGPECDVDGGCVDPLRRVCDLPAGQCVQCLSSDDCAVYSFPHVCDEPARACRECLSSLDCESDPSALGPSCDTDRGFCTCSDAADCASNPNGGVCDVGGTNACTCADEADCPVDRTCEESAYLGDGRKTCVPFEPDAGG